MTTSVLTGSLTTASFLACLLVSVICGILIAVLASVKQRVSKTLFSSLILLPPIVCAVILMVNGNVGTGIAVAGAFSLIRFRSAQGNAREIVSVFLSMTAGLCCAGGYIWIALILSITVGILMVILSSVSFKSEREKKLNITVPETLNFSSVFDEILKKYTQSYHREKVKTVNMGSLYRISYRVVLKNENECKKMIDELRTRNGNLEIALSDYETEDNL